MENNENQVANQLLLYLKGEITETPEALSKVMANVLQRLTITLSASVVDSASRKIKLNEFITKAEEKIYNPELLDMMEPDEIISLYKEASKESARIDELQRKFILQNRDVVKIDDTPQGKLLAKIMSLTPEQSKKLEAKLKEVEEEEIQSNIDSTLL